MARQHWQIQRNPATKKLLNQLTKKVKIALQNHRVSSCNNYLSNMHPGDTNLWKASKILLNQEINTIPPLCKDNQLVTSDAKKCNVFSEMLFNTFSVNQISNTNNNRRVLNFLDLPDYSVQKPMVHVTPNEIKLIIKKLPNKKAPGNDRITNIMFKNLPAIDENEKNTEASFILSYNIARAGKPHTIAESLIKPSLIEVVSCILGDDAGKKVAAVQYSNNTISDRIHKISDHIEDEFVFRLINCNQFSLQMDESTDVFGLSILIVFARYAHQKTIQEGLLICESLETHTTGEDIFEVVNKYIKKRKFHGKNVCMHGRCCCNGWKDKRCNN
ncbi:hypothetical protein QTP88_002705 [Uroleucon formosanum]